MADVAAVEFLKLAHLDLLAQMVKMDKMVLQVKTVTMVLMAQLLLLNPKLIGASNVLMLPLVPLVMLDLKALLVMLVLLVPLLMAVHVAHLALLVPPALLDKLEQTEMLVPLVNPVLSTMFPAQKAQLVPLVQMVNPDLLALLAQMDNLVNPVEKELPEMLVPMVPQETQVPMEKMVPMEKLELVENAHIVLPHVPLPVIKPFNNIFNYHLWKADLFSLKAWLPLVESTNNSSSFSFISLSSFYYLVIVSLLAIPKTDSTWVVMLVASLSSF